MPSKETSSFSPFNRDEILQSLQHKEKVTVITPHNIHLTLEKGVFVPDEGTFKLIDYGHHLLQTQPTIKTIADIGTGSGVIGVTLAKQFQEKQFYAYDISPSALTIAKFNAQQNNASNIHFFHNRRGEWLHKDSPSPIDLIITNPPFTGNQEYLSPTFSQNYPDYQLQPKQAVRTYDTYGITPFNQITRQAHQFQAKYILFRCNPLSVETVMKHIKNEVVAMTKTEAPSGTFLFAQVS